MKPFAPNIPSVFIVDSPLQAICAVAAIKQLSIEKYRMIVVRAGDGPRYSTITHFLQMQKIGFATISHNHFTYKWYQLLGLIKRTKNPYKRLFIGYFGSPFQHFVGSCAVADGADVVYLDDGVATVTLLKHRVITDIVYFQDKRIIKMIGAHRNLVFYRNILTMYSDISNKNYNVKNLQLDILKDKDLGDCHETGVFIVGTHSQSYCKQLQFDEEEFDERCDSFFARLKSEYVSEKIIFIPHRLDNSEYAQKLCHKYGFEFRPAEITIEVEMMQNAYIPKAIFGFTSSALFNLKKMFPNTYVANVVFEPQETTEHYQDFLAISAYYEQNGIELIKM